MRGFSQDRSRQRRGRLSYRHSDLQGGFDKQAGGNDNTGGLRDFVPASQ